MIPTTAYPYITPLGLGIEHTSLHLSDLVLLYRHLHIRIDAMMRFLTSALALTAGLLGANVVAVARQQLPLIEHKEHLEEAGYTLFRYDPIPDVYADWPAE